jgi:hypothetical protein
MVDIKYAVKPLYTSVLSYRPAGFSRGESAITLKREFRLEAGAYWVIKSEVQAQDLIPTSL